MKNTYRHLLITTALTSALFASIAIADETSYSPVLEISNMSSKKRTIGEINYMQPIWNNDNNLVFADVKLKADTNKGKEVNVGLVYRHNLNDAVVLGVYNYFDYRKSGNNFSVAGYTGGVEALSKYVDARVNIYLPQNKKKKISKSNTKSVDMVGTSIFAKTSGDIYEQSYKGFDVEIGTPVFGFSDELNDKIGTKIFVAKYNFTSKGAKKISGLRFRMEQPLGTLELGNAGLQFMLNAETQYDNVRKRQYSAGISARLVFDEETKIGRRGKKSGLSSRMMDKVIRDVDIVTSENKAKDAIHTLEDQYGRKINNLYHVSGVKTTDGDGTQANPFTVAQLNTINTNNAIVVALDATPGLIPNAINGTSLTLHAGNTHVVNLAVSNCGTKAAITHNDAKLEVHSINSIHEVGVRLVARAMSSIVPVAVAAAAPAVAPAQAAAVGAAQQAAAAAAAHHAAAALAVAQQLAAQAVQQQAAQQAAQLAANAAAQQAANAAGVARLEAVRVAAAQQAAAPDAAGEAQVPAVNPAALKQEAIEQLAALRAQIGAAAPNAQQQLLLRALTFRANATLAQIAQVDSGVNLFNLSSGDLITFNLLARVPTLRVDNNPASPDFIRNANHRRLVEEIMPRIAEDLPNRVALIEAAIDADPFIDGWEAKNRCKTAARAIERLRSEGPDGQVGERGRQGGVGVSHKSVKDITQAASLERLRDEFGTLNVDEAIEIFSRFIENVADQRFGLNNVNVAQRLRYAEQVNQSARYEQAVRQYLDQVREMRYNVNLLNALPDRLRGDEAALNPADLDERRAILAPLIALREAAGAERRAARQSIDAEVEGGAGVELTAVNRLGAAHRALSRVPGSNYTEEIVGRFNVQDAMAYSLTVGSDVRAIATAEAGIQPEAIFTQQKKNVLNLVTGLADWGRGNNRDIDVGLPNGTDHQGGTIDMGSIQHPYQYGLGLPDRNPCAHGLMCRMVDSMVGQHPAVIISNADAASFARELEQKIRNDLDALPDPTRAEAAEFLRGFDYNPGAQVDLVVDIQPNRVDYHDSSGRVFPAELLQVIQNATNFTNDLFGFANPQPNFRLVRRGDAQAILQNIEGIRPREPRPEDGGRVFFRN